MSCDASKYIAQFGCGVCLVRIFCGTPEQITGRRDDCSPGESAPDKENLEHRLSGGIVIAGQLFRQLSR
jgi:hypothetical protein